MTKGVHMKFIHIADVHLGVKPNAGKAYSYNREREIWDAFKNILEICEKQKIELLLIAGDLFHRQPLLRELKEVDYMFSKLSRTKVVFIVGNHDYLKENSYYGSFVWSENVYPIFSEGMDCIEIEELELAVYGCSYHQKEVLEDRLSVLMKLAKQKYHILLGHGGDATHMPFKKAQMEMLPYDYIALGHIHKPEILIENKMAYAGALEPVDIGDYGEHGYIQGEMKVHENQCITEILFHDFAKREYKKLQVEVDSKMTHYALKDYLYTLRSASGMHNLYQVELIGARDPEIMFLLEELDDIGNIIDIVDHTKLDYNLDELERKNKDNLLGAYIRSFGNVVEGSREYLALYQGVQAIEETKKG